jgi:hypothetical protein
MGVKCTGLKVTKTDLEVKMAVTDGFENGQPLLPGSTNEQLRFRLLHRIGNYR